MGILSLLNEYLDAAGETRTSNRGGNRRGSLAVGGLATVVGSMKGPEKVAKAFELTEMTRQIMRAGIRRQHPEASESEIQEIHIDRLLLYHGTSLMEVRLKQRQQRRVSVGR